MTKEELLDDDHIDANLTAIAYMAFRHPEESEMLAVTRQIIAALRDELRAVEGKGNADDD